jgi:nucleotide-binding universal stress UspA family protein
MKIKPSQKLEKLMREVNARTEPRAAAALFKAARNLPAVRLKKILATTDFSKLSRIGLRYAVSLADKLGATLALLHVVEPSPRFAGEEGVLLVRNDLETLELAERQISKLANTLSNKDSAVRAFVRYGKPFNEIAVLASAREVDLIVMATHGHTGLKRVLLGSTAERVVRHARCPVLTIPSRSISEQGGKAFTFRLKKILVPIDFSQTSAQALPYAASLAERFGAEVILLHVIEPLPLPVDSGYVPPGPQSPDRKVAQDHLLRLRQEVFAADAPARTLVRIGAPFQEIADAAKSLGADLIVLTTHGYTGLTHVLLGSTAERVVRYADCPVLVVREWGTAAANGHASNLKGRSKQATP